MASSNRIIAASLYFLAFLILASCLAPIGVETDFALGRLIISGQVSTVPHRNLVQVGRTAGTERKQFDVSDAFVRIVDNSGNAYTMKESKPGIYTNASFAGVPGVTYHVEVDINDKHFESIPETLPQVLGTETISYDFETKDISDREGSIAVRNLINLRTHVNIPSASVPYYLKWEVLETWLLVPTNFPDPFGVIPPSCYINQAPDPQRIVLFNGKMMPSLDQQFLITTRLADNQSFHTKHVFYIYQNSITAEAFEYWRKVNILVNQVGSIFDAPPAEITGNIGNVNDASDLVYGYFQANNENYTRIRISSTDLPFKALPYCEYNASIFPDQYPYECLDCSDAPGSTYLEPPLFVDR